MPGASSSVRAWLPSDPEGSGQCQQPAAGWLPGRSGAAPDPEHHEEEGRQENVQGVGVGARREAPGHGRDGEGEAASTPSMASGACLHRAHGEEARGTRETRSADSRLGRNASLPNGWRTTEASHASSV